MMKELTQLPVPKKKHLLSGLALLVVLGVLPATLSACANDKSVTFKSAGMTHTFNEGEEGVPKDLAALVYPGSQVAGSTFAADKEGERSAFVTLSSPDSLERVSDWYQSALPKNGWKIDSQDATTPAMVSISGHQEDVEINVVMAQDDNKTTVSISQGKSVDAPLDEEEIENFTPNEVTPPTE